MKVRGMKRSSRPRSRPSRPLLTILAGAVALLAVESGPARAQFFDDRDMPMPPRAVVWRLADRGFSAIARPQFDGRAYVVEADDPYGERVRVFVDAHDGAILRRQRLSVSLPPPPVRIGRTAPGYGWTEEETVPRRPIHEVEQMVPPGDVPNTIVRRASPSAAPASRIEVPDRNPMGLNPDAKPQAPPKVARLAPAAKPASPRVTPQAPRLSETPPTAMEAKPSAALDASKPVTPATNTTVSSTAAVQPQAEKRAAKEWKDPPADQRKAVRVIGGATVVPGVTPQGE